MQSSALIKVLLIGSHPLILEGLKVTLEACKYIDIVGAAKQAKEGLELAAKTRPTVVLMDINMPPIDGIEVIGLFRERNPAARLLLLSMHDSREFISSAILRGASGYILRDVSIDEIVTAVEAVAAGRPYFSAGVSDVLLERNGTVQTSTLSAREYAVLKLVALGHSNKDIADKLAITVMTVETHRKKIKRKLGISTTAGLTRYAIDHGII